MKPFSFGNYLKLPVSLSCLGFVSCLRFFVCVDGMEWFDSVVSFLFSQKLDGWMMGLGKLWPNQYTVSYIPPW